MSQFTNFLNSAAGGTVLSGGIGLINGLINQGYNRSNMRLQQGYTQQNMALQNTLNKDFQKFAWDNAIPQTVASMKAAGLNPAGANTSLSGVGATGNPSGPSGPSAAPSNFDLLQGVTSLAQARVLQEQAKGQSIKNDIDAIELKHKQDAENVYDSSKDTYLADPNTGKEIPVSELQDWIVKNSDGIKTREFPDVVIVPNSYGRMEARKYMAENKSALSRATAEDLANRVQINVSNMQLSDSLKNDITNALARVPVVERDKMLSEISRSKIATAIDQYKLDNMLPQQLEQLKLAVSEQELTTISGFLKQLKDPSLGAFDKFIAGIAFIAKSLLQGKKMY